MTLQATSKQSGKAIPPDGARNYYDSAVLLSLLVPSLAGLYLLLTSTSVVIPGIWPYDAKRILQFVLLLVFFLMPLLNVRIGSEFSAQLKTIPTWLKISLLAVAVVGLISVAVHARSTPQLVNSLSEVVLMGLLVLAIPLIASSRRIGGPIFDWIVIGSFTITGLVVGAQELIGILAAHAGGVEFNFRVSLLHFSWPRFFNQVQSWMLLPLVSLVILFPGNRLARLITLVVLSLQWYVILMTGGRGVFVSVLAAILLAGILLPAIRKPLVIWQAAGLLAGVIIYLLVMFSFAPTAEVTPVSPAETPTQQQREASQEGISGNGGSRESSFYQQSLGRSMTDSSGRVWMWKTAFGMAKSHPWLGIGPLNMVCAPGPNLNHPHNFPMQLMAEWGIPVAVAACVIVIILMKSAVGIGRKAGRDNSTESLLFNFLLVGAMSAGMYGLLSGVFVMPASQVSGLLVLGLLLGLAPVGKLPQPASRSFAAVTIPLFLSVGLLALGIFELATMEARAALLEPAETLFPRTWQDAMVCRLYSQ